MQDRPDSQPAFIKGERTRIPFPTPFPDDIMARFRAGAENKAGSFAGSRSRPREARTRREHRLLGDLAAVSMSETIEADGHA